MIVIAIDPGPSTSGVVVLDATDWPPTVISSRRDLGLGEIQQVIAETPRLPRIGTCPHVVVEGIVPYLRSGGVIGATTIETAMTIGGIREMVCRDGGELHILTRPEVGHILCPGAGPGTPTGYQVAEAIRDIYRRAGRATGGGVDPVIGTRREPGPLHGIALGNHEGSALAVGLAWLAWLMRDRQGGPL
jgi:hypothetical protein